MLSNIIFASETVAPIFLLIFIGVLLRRFGIINAEFITVGSTIVFKFALPAMVFVKMSQIKGIPQGLPLVIMIFIAAILIIYSAAWFFTRKLPAPLYGSFVQGSSRGNITIIGLAVIENAFGLEAVQAGLVILMVIMPLHNLLAVIVLGRSSAEQDKNIIKQVLLNLIKNPLIWAIAAGIPFGFLNIRLPSFAQSTIGYLSQLTMPLALLSIGGSLTLSGLMKRKLLWISGTIIKLLILPLLVCIITVLFDITGSARYAVVLAAACPSAVSGFSMAVAMGADGELAGEIVSASTLFSIISLTAWIVVLAG